MNMKQGKMALALLLALTLLASLGVCAYADEDAIVVQQTEARMTVKCVDTEGTVLRNEEADYLDLSKDLTVDASYKHPEIENYTYSKTTLDGKELTKLTVTHDEEGNPVITAFLGSGDSAEQKTLTGSETLFFVYEKKAAEHTHDFGEGKVTKEPTCTEKGEKTYTCSCGETKTEEVAALGHDFANGRCKRCGAKDPNFKPKLTDNTEGHANWGSEYIVYSDALRKDFEKILVDGKEVPAASFSIWDTKNGVGFTLSKDFIKTLNPGEHEVSVVFATGTAAKTFSVSDKPRTGDESVALYAGLLILSALGMGAVLVTAKKRFGSF